MDPGKNKNKKGWRCGSNGSVCLACREALICKKGRKEGRKEGGKESGREGGRGKMLTF
jgi:hypothetical protein